MLVVGWPVSFHVPWPWPGSSSSLSPAMESSAAAAAAVAVAVMCVRDRSTSPTTKYGESVSSVSQWLRSTARRYAGQRTAARASS